MTCLACRERLTYQVHSAAWSLGYRRRLGIFALLGALLIPAGIALVAVSVDITDSDRGDWTGGAVAGIFVVVLGIIIAQVFNLRRESFAGVTGPGAPHAGFAKHIVHRIYEVDDAS